MNRKKHKDERGTTTTASVWASGALIQDRLFAYALLQYTKRDGIETYGNAFNYNTRNSISQNTSQSQKTPNWLLKLDWAINEDHSLELTAFSDKRKTETDVYRNLLAG